MIIYIAGKYNAATDGERLFNTERAIDYGIAVYEKGHYPIVPHLTHYIEKRMDYLKMPPRPNEYWYVFDNLIIPSIDALLIISKPGESKGADAELEFAKKLGKRIFYTLDEIPRNDSEF